MLCIYNVVRKHNLKLDRDDLNNLEKIEEWYPRLKPLFYRFCHFYCSCHF